MALLASFGVHLVSGLPVVLKKSFLSDIVCSYYGPLTRDFVDKKCIMIGNFDHGNGMKIPQYSVT